MKLPVSVYFCGGILGFGAYYLLTGLLWNLVFDGSFLMYLILALAVYICQAWFRFQWHKPERWLRALRPEDEDFSSGDKAWWRFHQKFNWLLYAGETLAVLLVAIFLEEQGAFMAAAMFLGALIVTFPVYFTIWGAFQPHHLRWVLRFLPFFREEPSREELRWIAVACMGGMLAMLITAFCVL